MGVRNGPVIVGSKRDDDRDGEGLCCNREDCSGGAFEVAHVIAPACGLVCPPTHVCALQQYILYQIGSTQFLNGPTWLQFLQLRRM
jgi:hypothetical protein